MRAEPRPSTVRPSIINPGLVLALIVGLAATTAWAHPRVPGTLPDGPVLLRGGDLYTVSGGVLEGTDLLFENGVITAIGPDLDAAGARVVDVTGHRVYPGLVAGQTTVGLVEVGAVRATRDLEEVGNVTPEVNAHTAYNPDSEIIPTVRSHGVTTAQVVPQGSLVTGRSFVTHLDGWTKEDAAVEMENGLWIEWPRVAVIDTWWMPTPPEEQREQMREERERLADFMSNAKAYAAARGAGAEVAFDQRLEAMVPVVRGELPVYVAADDARQIVEAVDFALEHGLELVIVGGREAPEAAELLRRHDVPVMVGATQSTPMRADKPYDRPFRVPALLHEAGIRFAISQGGSWNIRNLPFQAGQAVAFGLPEDVALRAITLSAAELLGIDDREGSLEVGKAATLFVSEGDVLDMLGQRVTHMWIDGRPVDLGDRHKDLYRKYDQKPAAGE